MPVISLPDEPSLEQLRNQARDLRRAVLAGQPEALAEAAAAPGPFPLHAAQRAVARRYGFPSWARLKHHVEIVERYSRFPDRLPADDSASAADRFLRLACLRYADDQPEHWAQARSLLTEHPELTAGSVHAAAAAADVAALRRILAVDPAAARHDGGPFRWAPLCYLAYARHDPQLGEDAVLAAARLLLDAGADPNAGYLWHGLPSPFTVLTGTFGEGELGPVRQPRHPHSLALARVLLQAGADPNDSQALYNRMFEPGDDHLELLLDFGLGRGDGGPWRARLGDALDSPAELVRGQLAWAVTHGMTARVQLLASHGADLTTPFPGGATVTSMAATTGHADLIGDLVAHGAPPPELDPAEAFTAAALAADQPELDRLLRDHAGLAAQVRSARPALITWAAACGRPEAAEILAGLGFDVNALGRTDVPSDQPWQTALHQAAADGHLELARTLLRLGANPDIRDRRFHSTALGWARYFGREPLVVLLEPLTRPDPDPGPDVGPGPLAGP
jgi:ankyrin repeat protein